MSWRSLIAAGLIAVTGCAPRAATPAPAAPTVGVAGGDVPGTRCDADAARSLVGRSADASVNEAKRLSGARTTRRYRSGDAVTMDFRADRLDIETDANGTIVKLSCG
jgi:hypothetical protein